MNARFLRVLRSAGIDAPTLEHLRWRDAMLIQNEAGVPGCADEEVCPGNRGFNVLLLSARGRPAHYCKCRPEHDPVLRRETEVLERLWADPALRAFIPEVRGARGDGIQIQFGRYVDGRPYSRVLAGLSLAGWRDSLLAIADAAARVSWGAAAALSTQTVGAIDLHAAAAESLTRLESAGLSASESQLLASLLRAAPRIEASPQHGDLWPPNILRCRDGWRLLDFEFFGMVWVPLYDVCHLLQTSSDFRAGKIDGGAEPMLGAMLAGRPAGRVMRAVLARAAQRYELCPRRAAGVVVFYLVDIADRIYRRRGPAEHWAPLMHRIRHAADLIRTGADLGAMLLGSSP